MTSGRTTQRYIGKLSSGARDRDAVVRFAIGLGSNLGDRVDHLADAVQALRSQLGRLRCSSVFETEPQGLSEERAPKFLNLCSVGLTRAGPRKLLEDLLSVEAAAGRYRARNGHESRTLDVDLLLYGNEAIDEPGLRVPHPRMQRRAFVLVPLVQIAASWPVPGTGSTVGELASEVDASGVARYGGELPPGLKRVIDP